MKKEIPERKGAIKRSDIPRAILARFHKGTLETKTLVEWLAIDLAKLLKSILPEVGLKKETSELVKVAKSVKDEGIMQRTKKIAVAIFEATQNHPDRLSIFEALSAHRSDVVRELATYMVAADKTLSFNKRLKATLRFAKDAHMGPREMAWLSFRPYMMANLEKSFTLLTKLTKNRDPNIRRFVSELTRPRGVWCAHIQALKENPESGLKLIEPLRSDKNRYVQTSVANWLNDASKTRADWVEKVCVRWLEESPTVETKWIVNHAMRTIRKKKS